MKGYVCRTILVAAGAISLGNPVSQHLLAQNCAPFPAGVVPFATIDYISPSNSAGDRLLVGEMGGRVKGRAASIAQLSKPEILRSGGNCSRFVHGGICPDAAGTKR